MGWNYDPYIQCGAISSRACFKGGETMTTAIAIIGCVVGVVGCIVGVVGVLRNKKNDDSSAGRETGLIMSEIGYIKGNTDDIKKKLDKHDDQNMKFESRLSKVEASATQAHKRIDDLSERMINNEKT